MYDSPVLEYMFWFEANCGCEFVSKITKNQLGSSNNNNNLMFLLLHRSSHTIVVLEIKYQCQREGLALE